MLISRCARLIHSLFFLVSVWITIILFITSIKKFAFSYVLLLVVVGFLIYLFKKRTIKYFPPQKSAYLKNFLILLSIAFLSMLVIGFSLRVDVYNTWDYGQLIRTAYENVTDGNFTNPTYYARYPNNSFYLLILSVYFKLLKPWAGEDIYNYINATIPVNCILVTLSILFSYLAARLFLTERSAFRCGLVLLTMSPFYLYSAIAYTDVFAVFPVSLVLFLYMKAKVEAKKGKKLLWLCFTALVLAAGYKIKATLIILFLAICIDMFFGMIQKKMKLVWGVTFALVFGVTVVGCSAVSTSYLVRNGVTQEMMSEEAFPITHWLMMSLNPKYEGGFNQEDVEYTMSYIGKEAKVAANIEQIEKRVSSMGIAGTIKHVFVKKVARMWGQGDCSASDYVARQALSENIFREIFSLNGRLNFGYRVLAQIYYTYIIMTIARNSILVLHRNKVDNSFVLELSFLGIFLFFLIWECNARYLFVFLPVIVLLASALEGRRRIDV